MTSDQRVDKRNIFFLVSQTDGIVGTVTYQFGNASGEAYIHMVGIAREHRGKGLSRCMLLYAIDKILEAGNELIVLTTDDFRRPAIKAYLNCGFVPYISDETSAARWRDVLSEIGI